jgi:hypothetical protein
MPATAAGPATQRPRRAAPGQSEPAALAYGLAFVPLASRHIDLVIPAAAGSLEVRGLRTVLSSRWLTDQLASLPGYDPSH